MKRLEYIGKVVHFLCASCDKRVQEKFMLKPSPAIAMLLSEEGRKPIPVCKSCARREVGSREWKAHAEK